MGTTLTGTTPQDTYDSLIKVTDNGPLTGSLKKLTDGLGNDSSLSLSTTAASLSGNLTSTGSASFTGSVASASSAGEQAILQGGYLQFYNAAATNKFIKLTDDSSTIDGIGFSKSGAASTIWFPTGNVGIGTSAPTTLGAGITSLDVAGTAGGGLTTRGTTVTGELIALDAAAGFYISTKTNHPIVLRTNDVERVRITNNGLTFNGDTAAANALDDYEEGTWTMTLAFGGNSVGINYGDRTGTYTKIGRQVTATGYMSLSNKGSSTGAATITGLPFTILNSIPAFCVASVRFTSVTFANQFFAQSGIGTTSIGFAEITEAGVDSDLTDANFANNSTIIVTITYFV